MQQDDEEWIKSDTDQGVNRMIAHIAAMVRYAGRSPVKFLQGGIMEPQIV